MATKLLTINSTINFHSNSDGSNCSLCGASKVKYAVWYDYDTMLVVDWKLDYEWDNGEAPLCNKCSDKFDFDILLEV